MSNPLHQPRATLIQINPAIRTCRREGLKRYPDPHGSTKPWILPKMKRLENTAPWAAIA